ncbi:hypothetical protein Cyrtocomes_00791 [Candidatus Cyrtobacter comes]|uniref:Uncharacterized protein n=1 Tax=Candidatus Cyrtobacter comes TaxID=675776 RepID=A0ABU5L8G0_9RICK|nr:hypothetical protein [Candidatus Cyrtobacter comes]
MSIVMNAIVMNAFMSYNIFDTSSIDLGIVN